VLEEQLKTETEQRAKIEAEAAEAVAVARAELNVKAESYAATIERLLEQETIQSKMDGLMQLLGDKEPSMRSSAMEALEQAGEQAVLYLIDALEDERWIVREHSAETLGRISDRRAVEPLLFALEDDNVWVRKSAGEALSLIGDEQAVEQAIESLERSLGDENEHVRRVATAGLKTIRNNVAKEDQIRESNGKQANSIIGKLIELKIYMGIGIGVILLMVGFTVVLIKSQKDLGTAQQRTPLKF
jgi:HEAT repeat protein